MAARDPGTYLNLRIGESTVRTHYHEMGPAGGAPVVFMQTGGAATSAWMCWYLNLPVFAEAGYRVLAPDNLGFGETQLVSGPAVRAPDFMGAFLDAMGVERAHFIGNSGGSMATTAFAAAHPERVASFITSGGEPRIDTDQARAIAPLLGRTARMDFVREMLSKPQVAFEDLRKATADFFYDPDHPRIHEVTEMRLELMRRPGLQEKEREAAFRQIEGGRQNIDNSVFERITAPTYLIHGRDERFFYAADHWPHLFDAAMKATTVIPACDCTVLAHCGHWPQIEMADRYNRLCLEFLAWVQRGRKPAG